MKHKTKIIAAAVVVVCLVVSGYTYVSHWTAKQNTAHEIAELARGMGLSENNPIIVEASRIWWEDYTEPVIATPEPEPLQPDAPTVPPEVEPTPEPEPVPEDELPTPIVESTAVDLWSGVLPYEITYDADTEYLAVAFAKLVYGEFRGGWSQMEQAAIIQTVYERYYDGTFGSSLWGILTQPYQFAYYPSKPTVDDYGRDLVALARDVIYRNNLFQTGQYSRDQVGIVLGAGYRWYVGNGWNHKFYPQYSTYGACGTPWNWSLPNPYES